MDQNKYLYIINPISGNQIGFQMANCIEQYHQNHDMPPYEIVMIKEGIQLKKYIEDNQIVIAAGGDGTVSSVFHAVIESKKNAKVFLIPLGVGNDLAKSLKIFYQFTPVPMQLSKALTNILNQIPQIKNYNYFDIFTINNIPIASYASLGFDALVVKHFDQYRKWAKRHFYISYFNKIVYYYIGWINLYKRIKGWVKIEYIDSKGNQKKLKFRHGLKVISISNVARYAGGAYISNRASFSDKMLELTIFKNSFEYLIIMLSRYLPLLVRFYPKILFQKRIRKMTILFRNKIPLQIDGEPIKTDTNRVVLEYKGSCLVYSNL